MPLAAVFGRGCLFRPFIAGECWHSRYERPHADQTGRQVGKEHGDLVPPQLFANHDMKRWVGLGVIADNLINIGNALVGARA